MLVVRRLSSNVRVPGENSNRYSLRDICIAGFSVTQAVPRLFVGKNGPALAGPAEVTILVSSEARHSGKRRKLGHTLNREPRIGPPRPPVTRNLNFTLAVHRREVGGSIRCEKLPRDPRARRTRREPARHFARRAIGRSKNERGRNITLRIECYARRGRRAFAVIRG